MKNAKWLALIAGVTIPLLSATAQTPAGQAAPNLSPGAAEVVKLAQAGMGDDVIVSYIRNSSIPFNLSADQILYLKDIGLSSQSITEMLNRDKALGSVAVAPAPAAPTPTAVAPVATAPAPAPAYVSSPPADVTYFYNDLAPYGAWVELPGYGWCWQPTVVGINRGWRPYCDGGHWVYSDAGWYWASDYSWGWAPFHYGRWYLHARCGWVWLPDRVWGPAWVTWRTVGDSCGWAPLPPHAVFDLHLGWRFNGVSVGVNFDFGLHADHFTFVSLGNFCDHDIRHRCMAPAEVTRIYHRTTVVNNYVVNNNIIVNQGIKVDRVSAATHTQIHKAVVRDLPAGSAPGRRLQGSDKSGLVVYRPQQLQAPARPEKMVAQKYDERHPAIQHSVTASQRVEYGSKPGMSRSTVPPASHAVQTEAQKGTPHPGAEKPASSRAEYFPPKSYQAASSPSSASTVGRLPAEPKAPARSTASYEPASSAASRATVRRPAEEPKAAVRSMPSYRPDVVQPTYPLRVAEQTEAPSGETGSKGRSSHVYYPKTYNQAAEVRALPPLYPRENPAAPQGQKDSNPHSKKNQ